MASDNKLLLDAFEKTRARMIDDQGNPVLKGWDRKIQFYFPDLNEFWMLTVVDGRPQLIEQEEDDETEVRLSMSSETFISLMDRTLSGFVAMTRGLVKIKATMGDMRKMQVFM